MISNYDIIYKNNLMLDFHLPESENYDLFVYFHGGGLTAGVRGGVEVFAKTLAKHNIATASIEYSLYPNAKYPDFIVDCADAIRFLKDNYKFNKLYVGGSSAGGYISMMLCFDETFLKRVGLTPMDVNGFIHNAGQPTTHFRVLEEYGFDFRRLIVDEKSPLYYVGSAETYPPMLFIVSDNDMPCRYEQTLTTVKTMEYFGHKDKAFLKVVSGKHCEQTWKTDENGEGVFANLILEFIDKISN